MTSTDLARRRDHYVRAASVVTALLVTVTLSTTAAAASLLTSADPSQAAVQPGLPTTHVHQQLDAAHR